MLYRASHLSTAALLRTNRCFIPPLIWAPQFTIFLNRPLGGRQSHTSGLPKLPFNLFQCFTIMKQITSSSSDTQFNCYNHITGYVMLCIVPQGSMVICPCLHMLCSYILKCFTTQFWDYERRLCDVFSVQCRETSHREFVPDIMHSYFKH